MPRRLKHILITGASGFVGQYLVRDLLKSGYYVLACAPIKQSLPSHPNLQCIKFDITNKKACLRVFKGNQFSHVFHLAAISEPSYAKAHPEETYQVNTLGTINLLEASQKNSKLDKFIFISTSHVYGKAFSNTRTITEKIEPFPQGPYALSKRIAELACIYYHAVFKLPIIIVRPLNHVGVGMPKSLVFSEWTNQIAAMELNQTKKVLRVGNIHVQRDFLHIKDVICAYKILLKKSKSGEIYNLSSGKTRELRTYLKHLRKLSKIKFTIKQDTRRKRSNDLSKITLNSMKLRKLGWAPKYSPLSAINDVLISSRREIVNHGH